MRSPDLISANPGHAELTGLETERQTTGCHLPARHRLAELLDPRTDQERELVTWLGDSLDLSGLTVLAALVEYRRSR